jgi:hypothetical protein
MLRVLTTVLLCIVCWFSTTEDFARAQNPDQLTEVNFSVKGVRLGSSYALVLRQFGRPLSSKREKILDETCDSAHTTLRLTYKGAVIDLKGDLRGRHFEVVSMEITSPQLLIMPGVKMGMTEQETRSKLGEPWQVSNESGHRMLNYVTKGNDGGAVLYFLDGRLVKVQWQYTLC